MLWLENYLIHSLFQSKMSPALDYPENQGLHLLTRLPMIFYWQDPEASKHLCLGCQRAAC